MVYMSLKFILFLVKIEVDKIFEDTADDLVV